MADEKKVVIESEKQARAVKARETRLQRKLAAEQQQERREWLFHNTLSEEEREQIIDDLQEISNEYYCLFEEFLEERDTEITQALEDAIEKHGYHHVLAALESGDVPDVYAESVHRDLAGIVSEDFDEKYGWELDPIDEMECECESAPDAFIDVFGGRFDEQGNYIPKAGANC